MNDLNESLIEATDETIHQEKLNKQYKNQILNLQLNNDNLEARIVQKDADINAHINTIAARDNVI